MNQIREVVNEIIKKILIKTQRNTKKFNSMKQNWEWLGNRDLNVS